MDLLVFESARFRRNEKYDLLNDDGCRQNFIYNHYDLLNIYMASSWFYLTFQVLYFATVLVLSRSYGNIFWWNCIYLLHVMVYIFLQVLEIMDWSISKYAARKDAISRIWRVSYLSEESPSPIIFLFLWHIQSFSKLLKILQHLVTSEYLLSVLRSCAN